MSFSQIYGLAVMKLFFYYYFLTAQRSLWDLSSQTSD